MLCTLSHSSISILLVTVLCLLFCFFFFFNDTATTEIYTLSLPTLFRSLVESKSSHSELRVLVKGYEEPLVLRNEDGRSEEHTSELQSHSDIVCRLLLEKKKTTEQLQLFRV